MSPTPRPSTEARRQAAIDDVLTAARRLVIAEGLAVTMDQIADAAGISRSTLFRLFTSHDHLVAAAFEAAMDSFERRLPAFDGDVERWLRALCDAVHEMNAGFGLGYWELQSRPDLSDLLVATEQKRRVGRRKAMDRITATLWREIGRQGSAPRLVVAAVNAHLSAHFTASVMTEAGKTWQYAADLAYQAILAALRDPAMTPSSPRPDTAQAPTPTPTP